MTTRADLLALTEDALVSLTNRGLYKRAAKEAAADTGPTITEDADAIRGTFPDGVICALPPGGLEAAACTCGASGACRHVVAVVLAYQATASDGTEEFEQWSPSEFTDDHLETLLGKRNFATARRRHATGYLARVHPATATEQVPRVELPNCSVRFLVPHDLAYARSDARDTKEAIALAVWAWRAWEALGSEAGDRHFAVGGGAASSTAGGHADDDADDAGVDDAAATPDMAADLGADAVSGSSFAAGGGIADGVAGPGIAGSLGDRQVGSRSDVGGAASPDSLAGSGADLVAAPRPAAPA
ncbi:SWIM zinc finger family protein, partial [Catenulispora rubra]|uniref:SWIM zinc finger family protein n=1 Tax=Catenulispora rubra TaxID=280293 RepID=UPI001892591F